MHVAVMGAGSVGSLVGGLLSIPHDVTLVAREPHVRAVARDGLRITGLVDRRVHPAATTDWAAVDRADLAVVTVKTYDTATAADELATAPPPVVLTLQNGMGTVGTLRNRLPPATTVLAGTCTYGARLESPGTVACTGHGEIRIGHPGRSTHPVVDQTARAFAAAPLDAAGVTDVTRRRWEKLAINAAINPVTALARVRNGYVCEPPLWPAARAAAEEAVDAAADAGVSLHRGDTVDRVKRVAAATAENESSMARDLRRGRRTEIDAIAGHVIDTADGPTPINGLLYALVKGYEIGADAGSA